MSSLLVRIFTLICFLALLASVPVLGQPFTDVVISPSMVTSFYCFACVDVVVDSLGAIYSAEFTRVVKYNATGSGSNGFNTTGATNGQTEFDRPSPVNNYGLTGSLTLSPDQATLYATGTQTVGGVISIGIFVWPANPVTVADRTASFIVITAADYGTVSTLDPFRSTGNIAGIAVDNQFIYLTAPRSTKAFLIILTNAAVPANVASLPLDSFRDPTSGGNFFPLSVRFTNDGTPNELLLSTFGQGRVIYLTLSSNRTVILAGSNRTLTALPAVGSEYDLVNDASSTIYTAVNDAFLYTFNSTGSPRTRFTGFPSSTTPGFTSNAQLYGVTVQPATGTLYVTDYPNRLVYRITGLIAPSVTSSSSTGAAAAFSDPRFVGFWGQSFYVGGSAGRVYNIISDSSVLVNAYFVQLERIRCPVVDGHLMVHCSDHPGTYFGVLAIVTVEGDHLRITAGEADEGFENVTLNDLPPSSPSSINVTMTSHRSMIVRVGLYSLLIENSDLYVDLTEVSVSSWSSLINSNKPEGLLGRTWNFTREAPTTETEVEEYREKDDNILGCRTDKDLFCPRTSVRSD